MNTFDLESVIDDVLDGVATAEQRLWLDRRRASDPVVRDRYAAREALFRALDGSPLTEAPADLLAGVMRGISDAGRHAPASGATPARSGAASGWLASLVEAFRHRPAMAWGYAASMAAIAVALVLATSRLPQVFGPQALPVEGTIGLTANEDRTELGSVIVVNPDAQATVAAYPGSGGAIDLVVRTESHPSVSAEIAVDLDDAEFVSRGPGLGFGREAFDPPGHLSARFDHAAIGSITVRPAHPGPLAIRVTLRSPGGVAHTLLKLGSSPPAGR